MKKKEELKYFDKEWDEMNAHFNVFVKSGDQEALHKFRVQIKKLKAMLILFESTSKHNGLMKWFKPVKKIFKFAGQIRDAHTNLQLSEQYELKNELFQSGQQKIIEDGTNEFRLNSKKFIRSIKDAYKLLKKQLPVIGNNSIAGYYKKQLEQIAVNFAVSGFTEDMHTNRKLIKILIYNHKLADKALNGLLSLNIAYLDKLQENIGKWHDNIIAEQLFSSPELNDKPIVAKIKRINAKVKRTILSIADDFLNKATTIEKETSIS
jgi:CHAD domain-containing protein